MPCLAMPCTTVLQSQAELQACKKVQVRTRKKKETNGPRKEKERKEKEGKGKKGSGGPRPWEEPKENRVISTGSRFPVSVCVYVCLCVCVCETVSRGSRILERETTGRGYSTLLYSTRTVLSTGRIRVLDRLLC